MKRLASLLALVVCATSASGDDAMAATLCDQTFTIYGKTAGDHSILLWDVELGGECESVTTFSLFLGYDNAYVMSTDRCGKEFAPQFLTDTPAERSVILEDSAGIYCLTDSVFFTVPVTDTTFHRKLRRLVSEGGLGDVREWYRACPVNCSDDPVFHGANAALVYRYPGGIYKNYGFKQAVYFPESRYLVLVTDQPEKAVGLDTMHGLLVYRLNTDAGVKK